MSEQWEEEIAAILNEAYRQGVRDAQAQARKLNEAYHNGVRDGQTEASKLAAAARAVCNAGRASDYIEEFRNLEAALAAWDEAQKGQP